MKTNVEILSCTERLIVVRAHMMGHRYGKEERKQNILKLVSFLQEESTGSLLYLLSTLCLSHCMRKKCRRKYQ